MLLTKEILPVGKYKIRTNAGRAWKAFDEDYLKKIVTNSNAMLQKGLRIPAPFDHKKEARPRTEDQEKEIKVNSPESAYNNGGYWRSFWLAPNKKGIMSLYGQIDTENDISKTNEEVSVSITDNFEDGLGQTWSDSLLHVAIVNHAVAPNQEPFEPGVTVVNMSMLEGVEEDGIIEELKATLRKVKINLPGSTTAATFLRDLLVAANQIPEATQDQLEVVPIYMSIGDNDMALTEAQAKALVDAKTTNPATNQPFTMEDLGFKKVENKPKDEILASTIEKQEKTIKGLHSLVKSFQNKFISDTMKAIEKRISSLVESGVISKEHADAALRPKVEFQMSVSPEGTITDHPLETTLSTLEAIEIAKKPNQQQFEVQPLPYEDGEDLSPKDIDEILDSLSGTGVIQ